MKTILFIGAFLSKQTGTKGVMEKLAEHYETHPFIQVKLVSNIHNPLLRALKTIATVLFRNYTAAHVDVFSGRSFYLSALVGYLFYLRKKPFILTLHGGRLADFYANHALKMNRLMKRAKSVHTPSRFLQAFFNEKGMDVQYLPNFVRLDIFRLPSSTSHRKPFSLLWVRAFSEVYNPLLPIEILNNLISEYPDASLTMIGPDKGLLAKVQDQITRWGLEKRVNITGPVPNEQLPHYYHTHAVFLNTTRYESFGVAVVEAAACGIPIVSSAVGEIPYLWQNGEEILTVESLDPVNFSIVIKQIFDHPPLSGNLSRNARKKSENFDFRLISKDWELLISDLLNT